MKKTIITIKAFAVFVLAVAIATSSFAQNQKDSMNNAAMQKLMIELSKTNKNHQLLLGLTGNWIFTGAHFSSDSGIKTIETKGTVTRKAIMDGRYFICETTGGKIKMPWSDGKEVNYKDMVIEGYDNDKKKFFSVMVANHWRTGIVTAEGSYDSTTRTITYELEMESLGEKRKFHDLIKILDEDHYLYVRYYMKGDQEIKVTESKYTRVKSGK
jgi:hypothetical protein